MDKTDREYRRHLKELTGAVTSFLDLFDKAMRVHGNPPERGEHLARLANALNLANDRAKHFGLDIPLKRL